MLCAYLFIDTYVYRDSLCLSIGLWVSGGGTGDPIRALHTLGRCSYHLASGKKAKFLSFED